MFVDTREKHIFVGYTLMLKYRTNINAHSYPLLGQRERKKQPTDLWLTQWLEKQFWTHHAWIQTVYSRPSSGTSSEHEGSGGTDQRHTWCWRQWWLCCLYLASARTAPGDPVSRKGYTWDLKNRFHNTRFHRTDHTLQLLSQCLWPGQCM